MQFYDYAYESVKVIRSLCRESRSLWTNEPDVIARMFKKQTIELSDQQTYSSGTINILKKGNRYKLFKFIFPITNCNLINDQIKIPILDEMPNIDIEKIHTNRFDNQTIQTLLQKTKFETKQDLFKVLITNRQTSNEP